MSRPSRASGACGRASIDVVVRGSHSRALAVVDVGHDVADGEAVIIVLLPPNDDFCSARW